MDGVLIKFFHFLMMIVFLTIYLLAFIVIKPFMINYKRKISTLSLKITYLIYLAVLLFCAYIFIFLGPSDIEYQLNSLFFIIMLICIFIPSLGILFRRRFQRIRVFYNYFFSVINLCISYFLIHKLMEQNWFWG
jgi:CDP-diglyceride synthetase